MTISTHRLRARVAAGVLGTLALTGATLVATPQHGLAGAASAAEPDEPTIPANCDEDETSAEFGGAKVSARYAAYFNTSTPAGRYLEDYVPQGLGVWENWRGAGSAEDVFLVGMHHRDEEDNRSRLYAMTMTPKGEHRGFVTLPRGAHAGGVKIHKGWVYVQYDNDRILRYRESRVREGLLNPARRDLGPGFPTNTVTGVSFFDINGDHLYGGFHDEFKRGYMHRYTIRDDGDLVQDPAFGPIEIPMKAQGVLVLNDTWIFSSSRYNDHRGNIYVVQRGYAKGQEFTSVPYRCFQSVAMTQELVGHNGSTYLLNESGAAVYAGGIHDIRNLHVANTETLRSLVW